MAQLRVRSPKSSSTHNFISIQTSYNPYLRAQLPFEKYLRYFSIQIIFSFSLHKGIESNSLFDGRHSHRDQRRNYQISFRKGSIWQSFCNPLLFLSMFPSAFFKIELIYCLTFKGMQTLARKDAHLTNTFGENSFALAGRMGNCVWR